MSEAKIWNIPATTPASPPIDPVDGMPAPTGLTTVKNYFNGGAIPEELRLRQVSWRHPAGSSADYAAVEKGNTDATRQLVYLAWRRLMQLNYLLIGPQGWMDGSRYNGEESLGAYPNYCHVFQFPAIAMTNPEEVTITWPNNQYVFNADFDNGDHTWSETFFEQPADGFAVVVTWKTLDENDDVIPDVKAFEFDSDSNYAEGNIPVTIGGTLSATLQNLVTAVETAYGTGCECTYSLVIGDPRALDRSINGGNPTSIMPGDVVRADRWGQYGTAQVLDVTFLGESGGTHGAVLTLSRPLDPTREDKLYLLREQVQPASVPFVALSLSPSEVPSPLPCKFSVEREGNLFPSYKAAYPTAPASAGIDGQFHCGKLDQPTVDLSEYKERCNNTACPLYEAYDPYYPAPAHYSLFFLARGLYLRQIGKNPLPAPESALFEHLFWRVGREDFTGLWMLLGLPVGYYPEGLYEISTGQGLYKDFWGEGYLRYRTQDVVDGYDEFLNFREYQQKFRVNSQPESDAVGILDAIAQSNVKTDPAGATSASRALVDDADRTPGYSHEAGLPRRIQGVMPRSLKPSLDGQGDYMHQVPVNKTFASRKFDLPGDGTLLLNDERTSLTVYDATQEMAPVASPGTPWLYTIKWQVPRFDETVFEPKTRQTKSVVGTVATATLIGPGLIQLEFAPQQVQLIYDEFNGTEYERKTQYCHFAGNVVAPDIAHEITNWKVSRTRIGDRQAKVYPGDVLTFTGIDGVALQVLAAKAYAGAADTSAIAPTVHATGIPDFTRANYNKRDVVICSLEGRNGQLFQNLGDIDGTGVTLASVMHSAISPPAIDYEGTATGYAPTLKRVTGGVATAVSENDFIYDPVDGIFYINASAWISGEYNLYAEMTVYDTRTNHPVENMLALDRCLTTAVVVGWFNAGAPYAGSGIGGVTFTAVIDSQNYTVFGYDLNAGASSATGVSLTKANYALTSPPVPWDSSGCLPNGSGGGSIGIGQIADEGGITLSASTGLVGFGLPSNLRRFASSNIALAWVELELTSATIYEESGHVDRTGGSAEWSTPSTLDYIALHTVMFEVSRDEYGDVTGYTPVSVAVPTSGLTKVEITTGVYSYRGTVDVTEIIKYLLDHLHEGAEYAIGTLGPGIDNPTSVSLQDVFDSWLLSFSGTADTDSNGLIIDSSLVFDYSIAFLSYSGINLGAVHVQIDEASLNDGPELPQNGATGYAEGPSLL